MENKDIAARFDRLADLLEIEAANPFRIRAYREAARTLNGLTRSVAEMIHGGEDLSKLPGIGRDLATKIGTIVHSGELPLLEDVESRTPGFLSDLMKVEGLGPKRVKRLYDELHITSLEDLERAARSGRISKLSGFGEKSQELIQTGIGRLKKHAQRVGLADAEAVARPLVEFFESVDGVRKVTIAGSFRRRRETVGDLDILVVARNRAKVMDGLTGYAEIEHIDAQGKTRAVLILRSGMHVDVRVVPAVSYGAALSYFTGSKSHSIALRTRALKRGLKLNEYGLFKGAQRVAGRTEQGIYRRIGLPYIHPELREDRGEIEAAEASRLPKLIRQSDIRGDLHCHTNPRGGVADIRNMAVRGKRLGYAYLAITDHSRRLQLAGGLDARRLGERLALIDELNATLDGIELLKSVEVEILEDGSLDLPDNSLRQLDMTVCAVHSGFGLSRRRQTERILRAMDNPYFSILAHPTGRLINKRPAYEIDMESIIAAAKDRHCILELNGSPERLDLNDIHCQAAREAGVRIALTSDAHSPAHLGHMRFAVGQARRGWLERGDVINTRSLPALRRLLKR